MESKNFRKILMEITNKRKKKNKKGFWIKERLVDFDLVEWTERKQ